MPRSLGVLVGQTHLILAQHLSNLSHVDQFFVRALRLRPDRAITIMIAISRLLIRCDQFLRLDVFLLVLLKFPLCDRSPSLQLLKINPRIVFAWAPNLTCKTLRRENVFRHRLTLQHLSDQLAFKLVWLFRIAIFQSRGFDASPTFS